MNLLFSCIGRRSYIIEYFRESLRDSDSIIGTSNTEWAPALRYCDKKFFMPDIVSDNYVDAMLQLCRDEKVDAVFSFLDQDVDILARHYDEFTSRGIIPILPKTEASTKCFDKFQTFRFLSEHQFHTPLTFIDLEAAIHSLSESRLHFPLIVKPRFGFASRNIFTAHTVEQLEIYFHIGEEMVVQEMIQGEEMDMDICNDIHGHEVLSVVPWKKIFSRAGEAEASVTIENSELLEIGVRLGKMVSQAGPMDVDIFKVDNNYHIIELNPRFGGGYPGTHVAGGDFPGMLVKMIRGERVAPRIGDYKTNMTMMKEYKITCGTIENIHSSYLKATVYV